MNPRCLLFSFLLCAAFVFAVGCNDDDSPSGPVNIGSPAISSILPPGASPGIQITIRGSNFGSEQGSGTVQVGGNNAIIDSWVNSEIKCTLPAGLSQGLYVTVTVTTAADKSASGQINITPPHTYQVTADHATDHYPCWSGSGDYIYFSSTRSGGANWDIYRIPAMGGDAERVTFDDAADFYPNINPSTGEIAWSSQMKDLGNTEGDYEIFAGYPVCIGPGSSCSITMVTDNDSRDLDPSWANNVFMGYSMAYTSEQVDQSGGFLAWKIMLLSSTSTDMLTEGRQPSFSSNGQSIVYSHQDNIYKIPTDGGVPVQLTATNQDLYPHWGWANDKIAFQRSNGGNFEDIFVMNSDGTGVEAIVGTSDNEYYPRWSPDCTKVVYYALTAGNFDIFVYVVP